MFYLSTNNQAHTSGAYDGVFSLVFPPVFSLVFPLMFCLLKNEKRRRPFVNVTQLEKNIWLSAWFSASVKEGWMQNLVQMVIL